MRTVVASLLLACGGCAGAATSDEACVDHGYADQFAYVVTPEWRTPAGLAVDATGQQVSATTLDALTDEVERCLSDAFGDPPRLPPDVQRAGDCDGDSFPLPIARGCLTVKIPDDWTHACDGAEEVLPAPAPNALCLAKGLVPTDDCPCRWRAGIQDATVIVTTPSLRLFKDPLIRIVTGCNDPWTHPLLARCAQPSG